MTETKKNIPETDGPPSSAPPKVKNEKQNGAMFTIRLSRLNVIVLSVMVALLSVILGTYWSYKKMVDRENRMMLVYTMGVNGIAMFEQYDRDKDGYLSLEEFEPLAHMVTDATAETAENYTMILNEDDKIVTVRSFFKPLRLETMTKSPEEDFFGQDALTMLTSWTKATAEWKNFAAEHFSPFIPVDYNQHQNLGQPYRVVHVADSILDHSDVISSNRFHPPKVQDDNRLLHQLLSMFHPRPFIVTRFQPRGGVACIRAYNEKYIDVEFRIHAEFQLSVPPQHPFWFTPAQFQGNVVISRDGHHLIHFHMWVPTTNMLNVDMEWLTGPNENTNMEVDIGFMDQMELNISAPSLPAKTKNGADLRSVAIPHDPALLQKALDSIEWSDEISVTEARSKLEKHFFKHKEVPYYKLPQALELAHSTHKLIHLILMWGALDDQSC